MDLECRIWMGSLAIARSAPAVGQTIRIVALTGWGREEDRVRTQAAGIDLHWSKPVDRMR